MQGRNVAGRQELTDEQSLRLFSRTPWPCDDAIVRGLSTVVLIVQTERKYRPGWVAL